MAPDLKPALIIIGSWIAVLIVCAAYQRNAFAEEMAQETARATAQAEHAMANRADALAASRPRTETRRPRL